MPSGWRRAGSIGDEGRSEPGHRPERTEAVLSMVRIGIGQFMEETTTCVRQRADVDHFRANQLLAGNEV